jgi:hypothetical protein
MLGREVGCRLGFVVEGQAGCFLVQDQRVKGAL